MWLESLRLLSSKYMAELEALPTMKKKLSNNKSKSNRSQL